MLHPRRWFPLTVSAIALGLTAAALVPATASASARDPLAASASELAAIQNQWSAIPAYATSPVLDAGRLVNPSGSTEAGATVLAFPDPEVTKADQPLTPVARATTDSAGNYTLRLPYSKWPQLLRRTSDKYMNVQVIVFWPNAMASYFTPIDLAGHKAASTKLTLRRLPAGNGAKLSASAQAKPDVYTPPYCAIQSRAMHSDTQLVVGYKSTLTASHINWTQYDYSAGESQTSGVGISGTSGGAGFSVDGSTTSNSTVSMNFPQMSGASNNDLTANATFEDDYLLCANPAGSQYGQYYEWYYQFNSVNSRRGTPGALPVAAGKCTLEAPGNPITYNYSKQTTWSAGASVSNVIGINLSSQDGYNSSSSLSYALKTTAPICGVTGVPGSSDPAPGYIQVH